jgi:ribosomal protein L12E/L44/L45/RPP1/RPP2
MADFDDDTTGQDSSVIAELRKQLKQTQKDLETIKETAAEASQLKRELAFAKAGIDLTDEKVTFFVKGYDGELDPKEIRSQAEKYGFIAKPNPTPEDTAAAAASDLAQQAAAAQDAPPGVPANELLALDRMNSAVGGSPLPDGKSASIAQAMRQVYEQGGTPEDVARTIAAMGYPVAQGYEG